MINKNKRKPTFTLFMMQSYVNSHHLQLALCCPLDKVVVRASAFVHAPVP